MSVFRISSSFQNSYRLSEHLVSHDSVKIEANVFVIVKPESNSHQGWDGGGGTKYVLLMLMLGHERCGLAFPLLGILFFLEGCLEPSALSTW